MAVSFIGEGNRIARENTTDLAQVIDKLYQILVVIGTDCIGSCKSYYHTITTATTTNNYNTQTIFLLKSNPRKLLIQVIDKQDFTVFLFNNINN